MPPELIPAAPLETRQPGWRGRAVLPADPAGWTGVVLTEWELTGVQWSDTHPFDELNYVLDGELEVECDGVRVNARTGDLVRVPAGRTGHYRAPRYARMLAVYTPNPDGAPSQAHGLAPA
jgi:quercetin dioxygenase-like cupin family protein